MPSFVEPITAVNCAIHVGGPIRGNYNQSELSLSQSLLRAFQAGAWGVGRSRVVLLLLPQLEMLIPGYRQRASNRVAITFSPSHDHKGLAVARTRAVWLKVLTLSEKTVRRLNQPVLLPHPD